MCANRFWLSRSPSMCSAFDLASAYVRPLEPPVHAVLRDRDVELHHQGVAVLAQHVARLRGLHDVGRAHEVVPVAGAERHAALEIHALVDDDGGGRQRRRAGRAEALGVGDETLQMHGVSQLLLPSG